MHPVLVRYLDPGTTVELLKRSESGESLGEEHRFLVEAARSHAPEKKAALASAGRHPTSEAQQAVLFLAVHAALRALREDATVKPRMDEAEHQLRALGAEQEDVDSMFAQLVADEAFGGEEDVDAFDHELFLEGLAELPKLAALGEQDVSALLSRFGASGASGEHLLRESAARMLLELAWADGVSPINVETVEEALEAVYQDLGEERLDEAAKVLIEFVALLQKEGLAGPLRGERLKRALVLAATGGGEEEEEEGDEEERV
ncbi:MAG: hypothetical protein WBV82_22310 [Myxococcaceae bacterium]